MAKLNVTLPDEQLAEVRALVASGAAVSVTAFVRHAVRVAVADVAEWREMLRAALAETGGPLTDEGVLGRTRCCCLPSGGAG